MGTVTATRAQLSAICCLMSLMQMVLGSSITFWTRMTTRKEVKRVDLGKGCAGILMDPDGSRTFVGCTSANYVAVVDLKTLTVTGHLDVGGGPDGLAWAKRPQ